jgi:hypothetical protein
MAYTTLEALKNYGGFEEDTEDVLLEALIQSASMIIEHYTGRVFAIDSETDQAFSRLRLHQESRFNGAMLYFYDELADTASAITDSPTVVYVPEDGPPYYGMYKSDGSWAYPTVTVTGYWGYSRTPPEDIQAACLRLSKWLYDMKDTTQGNAAIVTLEGKVLLPQGLPNDVKTILDHYKRITTG